VTAAVLRDTEPLLASKNNQGSSLLARLNIERPDDRHPKLKICNSELTLDSYEYIPVAYVIKHCMIWP
jgi:hypothetical protein